MPKRKILSYNETHKEVEGAIYKLCIKHKELFPDEDEWILMNKDNFYNNLQNKQDGLHPYCKKCSIILGKKWREENSERRKQSVKEWNQRPDVNKRNTSKKKIWRESNKDKHRGYVKSFRINNKEKVKEYLHKRKFNKNHNISEQEWIYCKQYFYESCAYCGISEEDSRMIYGQGLHKEHVENNGSNDLSNCVPACRGCNSSKLTSKLNDWYMEDNKSFNIYRLEKILKWLNEDFIKYKDNTIKN